MEVSAINQSHPTNNQSVGPDQKLVQKFYDLWSHWYQNPTTESAQRLIDFLTKNSAELEKIADANPDPSGCPIPAKEAMNSAVNDLEGWIAHGADPDQKTMVSEFVADMYAWVAYDRPQGHS